MKDSMLLSLTQGIQDVFAMAAKWLGQNVISFLHLACTFVPLFFFMDLSFTRSPYGFTLVGQYIMKNVVMVSAALVLDAHHRRRVATP